MLIKVFSVLSMLLKLSKLPPGVCWRRGGGGGATGLLNKGGGSNRLPVAGHGLVTEQQAVEFPQVLASNYNYTNPIIILLVYNHACMWTNCGQLDFLSFSSVLELSKFNRNAVIVKWWLYYCL